MLLKWVTVITENRDKSMLLRIIFIIAVLTVINVFAQLQIDSNFDSGNIGGYTINGNDIEFVVNSDGLSYEYWTNFKVSGVLNQQVTFNITNADDVPFLSDTEHESQIVYSYNGDDWYRLTNHSYNIGIYTITETFTQDVIQIATFFPFSYQKMHDYVDWIKTSEWATETVLGSSHLGRDIDLLTITNSSIPVANKKNLYIIGRQHAAEASSSHMLKGLIDFLISDDIYAHGFRNNYVWYIVPMVNPDGVYVGNSRATSEGNDANRDWGNDDTEEVTLVRNHISTIDAGDGIDMFIDWHSQMNDDRWYNFVYSPTGNTFFSILSSWTDFDSQSASGASSCNPGSCTARGWAMNEGLLTFVFEPTPHLVSWTIESLNEQGELTAFAINDYYDMYEVGPVDTRLSFVSNIFNSPSQGLGTLIIDVETMSNDVAYDINEFQGAFQLDDFLQTQNPSVTFSSANKLFSSATYTTIEDYRSSNGRVSYEYTYNNGIRGTIQTGWLKVVQVSIEYNLSSETSTISWYDGIPTYNVTDNNNVDRTGWELEIPVLLNDISLPVQLSSFTATSGNSQVTLKWTTESELENDAFLLDRGEDNQNFIQIAEIDGQGNSSHSSSYEFVDQNVIAGNIYWYCLADRDYSGNITYHHNISITVEDLPKRFILYQNYPNPFNPVTNINYTLQSKSNVKLSIFDLTGSEIRTLVRKIQNSGKYTVKFDASNLASGIYIYRLQTDLFEQSRKMILIQ